MRWILAFIILSPLNSHAGGLLDFHDSAREMRVASEARPQPGEFWLAVVGDSSVTGAAANPAYAARFLDLLAQAVQFAFDSGSGSLPVHLKDYPAPVEFGISSPVPPLTRVFYSQAEFSDADKRGQAVQINLEAKASLRLDTPEYSFGYMVGRALGIDPAHIVLTGQDGKRVSSLSRQFARIFEVGTPTLPPLVLVSYVANDFCHPDNFTRPVSEFEREYRRDLQEELSKIARLPADPRGTRVVFLAPLDVANILTNPDVASQEIPFEGLGQITCQDLRAGNIPASAGPLAKKMSETLIGECRGVLSPTPDMPARVQRVRDLQAAQVRVLADVLADASAVASPGLLFELATSIREVDFHKGDLAGDCFHPGIAGHTRIARQLLSHELTPYRTR